MIAEAIKKLAHREDLSSGEAEAAMDSVMRGEATPAQIAGFVMGLRGKGEKGQELAGCVASMRKHSLRVHVTDSRAVDGCGTGGDGGHTFNISTAASLIAAGAGVAVAKHGNRSVSSRCGSADVLEALGGNADPGVENVQQQIDSLGFCFMFAPRFHPAMKHAAPVRKELGVRTIFNLLGPLSNPAMVKRQMVGVYEKRVMRLVAEALLLCGSEHALIVHSLDGLDELSISAPTEYVEINNGSMTSGVFDPAQLGITQGTANSLAGGDASVNAGIISAVMKGSSGPQLEAALLNAGGMLYVAERAESIREGVTIARQAVERGKAFDVLASWVQLSRGSAPKS